MNDVKYSTNSEKKLIQALQIATGAYANGIIGTDTLTSIAIDLKADCFPLTVKMYGMPVIIGNDILPFTPKGNLKGFKNSMCGSFSYPSGEKPCSIMISNGNILYPDACHSFLDKPESVLYRTEDGYIGMARVKRASELPKCKWAVGGMGLGKFYSPDVEGFSGVYADVLRKTNHMVLGVKNNMLYGVYFKSFYAKEINTHVTTKFKFDYSLLLDGGHLAAINGEEAFAQINTSTKQGYGVQFI